MDGGHDPTSEVLTTHNTAGRVLPTCILHGKTCPPPPHSNPVLVYCTSVRVFPDTHYYDVMISGDEIKSRVCESVGEA